MNSADFTFLLNQPDAVNDRQTDALEKIITEFPYFQSARALRLKGLYNQNSFQYNYALKVSAAYTTDRSVLFDFITSDTFTAIHKGLYEEKLAELHGIEVKGSEVLAEDDNVPAVDKVEQSILTSIKESESPYEETVVAEAEIQETEIDTADEIPAPEMELSQYFVPEFVAVEDLKTTAIDDTAAGITEEATESIVDITQTKEAENIPDYIEMETVSDFGGIEETKEEAAEETPEKKLHIGEPLAFSKSETHSFQEWLQLSRVQPIVRDYNPVTEVISENEVSAETATESTSEDDVEKTKKNKLIDRFIQTNPKIPQIKQNVKPAVIEEPKEDHSALMTETLARVYLEQKKYQKAIQAYEILILKYPEKSSFFADRISEIKNLQQNNI